MPSVRRYWLLKTEPDVFSIQDLAASPDQTTCWDGVRNYQARNMLRDDLKREDRVLIYHSRVAPMAVAGTATVVRPGYPDPTQFDSKSRYHDPDSDPSDPRWFAVDVRLDRVFEEPVTRDRMRDVPGLEEMELLRRGSRLSVQPVRPEEWRIVLKLAGHRP